MDGSRVKGQGPSIKNIRVLFSILIFGCCVAGFVTGCGDKSISSQKKGEGKKDVEITMWLIGSEAQALTIKEIAGEFYNRTKIKVKCDAISWGDAHSKYLTSIAGGVAPDIGTMGLTWGTEFGTFGAMVDLAEAYTDEIKSIKETVFTGLWDSIEYRGKVYGIPFDMTEYVMYYRNDIIAKPPQTWDELVSLLIELNKKGKGMLFDWGSMSWIGYSPFLWQAGGDYYSSDYSQVIVDSPEAVLAMKFFTDLYKKYNVPKTKIPLEQGMRTGDFPLAISGNWKVDGLRLSAPEIAGKWSIATLPEGPTGRYTAFIGGRIIGIFTQSKKKEEAWEFIKFLFRPDSQKILHEAALTKQDTYLPPSKITWDILEMNRELKEILFKQAHDAKGPPAVSTWDTSAKYIDEAIQKIILQNADPQKELGIAKQHLMRQLKK